MKLDIQYFLWSKQAKGLIISLILLFSILIVFEYVKLFLPLPDNLVKSKETGAVAAVQDNSFNALLHSSLFGVYVPEDLNQDNVKASRMDLILVGVLFGNSAEESQVIIRTANGEEKTYKVNDKLPGDAVVKRIMPDGILIERHGALESISLVKEDLKFEPLAKPLLEP